MLRCKQCNRVFRDQHTAVIHIESYHRNYHGMPYKDGLIKFLEEYMEEVSMEELEQMQMEETL